MARWSQTTLKRQLVLCPAVYINLGLQALYPIQLAGLFCLQGVTVRRDAFTEIPLTLADNYLGSQGWVRLMLMYREVDVTPIS